MKALLMAAAIAIPHTYAGWYDPPLPGADAYRATITVPTSLPAGSEDQYAWVAVIDPTGSNFTQIGWMWQPGMPPAVFAFSWLPNFPLGEWFDGPNLRPGGAITVQIVDGPNGYVDEYQQSTTWHDLATLPIAGAVNYQTQVENYGPPINVCFSGRSWAGPAWQALPDGCNS